VQTLPARARAAGVRAPARIRGGAGVGKRDVLDARLAAAGRDPVLRRLVAA
jgi:hypothetical protein